MLVEEDRTSIKIDEQEDIERLWNSDRLFKKWRGETAESDLKSVRWFSGVHNNGCHFAYNAYKENIFQ